MVVYAPEHTYIVVVYVIYNTSYYSNSIYITI